MPTGPSATAKRSCSVPAPPRSAPRSPPRRRIVVNIPYRYARSLAAQSIAGRLCAMRRTAGGIVLALIVALIVGALLSPVPEAFDGAALRNLVPLDNPIALST